MLGCTTTAVRTFWSPKSGNGQRAETALLHPATHSKGVDLDMQRIADAAAIHLAILDVRPAEAGTICSLHASSADWFHKGCDQQLLDQSTRADNAGLPIQALLV